ncbi:MAG TPA: hypothetical protein VFT01_02625 [Homoserinimonas sp.]|nr:hypothetical protein [Homoserinimonas sp.]
MITLDFVGTTPTVRPGVTLVQLHNELWRVTRATGEVLGYIERFTEAQGERFRAKRLLVQQRRFVVTGEFWGIDEAIDCFA